MLILQKTPCKRCSFRFLRRDSHWIGIPDVYYFICERCHHTTFVEVQKYWRR